MRGTVTKHKFKKINESENESHSLVSIHYSLSRIRPIWIMIPHMHPNNLSAFKILWIE